MKYKLFQKIQLKQNERKENQKPNKKRKKLPENQVTFIISDLRPKIHCDL